MRPRTCLVVLLGVAACAGSHPGGGATELCSSPPSPSSTWTVIDRFCRPLDAVGITLVDWDGYVANPEIQLAIIPPRETRYPVTVTITSDEPRIYFDLDGRPDRAQGAAFPPPIGTLTFDDESQVAMHIAIWPDRDGADEEHTLHLAAGDVTTDVPIHVIDQDLDTPINFPITVDFSKDALLPDGTRFFDDPAKRALVTQAANDWAYFFDGTGLDPVAAGSESTTVDDAAGWYGPRPVVTNAAAFTGFLLYATGVHTADVRSTGYPPTSPTYQSRAGVPLAGNLHRSGALEIEEAGNYNSLGWYLSTGDEDWYLWDNLGDVANDLASIVHHEMGHALFFDGGYENFMSGTGTIGNGTSWGTLRSPQIAKYYSGDLLAPAGEPGDLPIDFRNHFVKITNAGVIDPASGLGAFGNEYADDGAMPRRRWIITKVDLLAAAAVGYPVRMAMAMFQPVRIANPGDNTTLTLDPGTVAQPYAGTLVGTGGVPAYYWSVVGGGLPPGLTLDSFSGAIEGMPTTVGAYLFSVELADSLGAVTAKQSVQIVIAPMPTSPTPR